jgi:hypothetical protein
MSRLTGLCRAIKQNHEKHIFALIFCLCYSINEHFMTSLNSIQQTSFTEGMLDTFNFSLFYEFK